MEGKTIEPRPHIKSKRWPDHRPETLRVEEVAQILGLGRTKTYALIKQGEIPSLKLGGARRVSKAVIDRMLAADIAAS